MADVHKQRSANGHTNDCFDQLRRTGSTSQPDKLMDVFRIFDVDQDGFLDRQEFYSLLESLFSNNGKPYPISGKMREDIFKLLDENQDGKIDKEEFKVCWYHWLKQVLDPVSAFIIVDVQNDFISGTLPVGAGENVVSIINQMMDNACFDHVIYSLDWHPSNHISFLENIHLRELHHTSKISMDEAQHHDTVVFSGPPIMEQIVWPTHCVQDSWGAELHKDLKVVKNAVYIHKGTNPEIDSYSAFWDNKKMSQTDLVHELSKRNVTDVYVCGLAYDVCVGATSFHALEHGFRTILVEDAARGISPENIEKTRDKLLRHGAAIVDSHQVADMVSGLDRRPELGYHAALNVAMARKLVKEGSEAK